MSFRLESGVTLTMSTCYFTLFEVYLLFYYIQGEGIYLGMGEKIPSYSTKDIIPFESIISPELQQFIPSNIFTPCHLFDLHEDLVQGGDRPSSRRDGVGPLTPATSAYGRVTSSAPRRASLSSRLEESIPF
jgi:hypothetical protein